MRPTRFTTLLLAILRLGDAVVSSKETDTEATAKAAEKNEHVDQAPEASALPEPSALASPERSMYDSGYTQVCSLFSRQQKTQILPFLPHKSPISSELT